MLYPVIGLPPFEVGGDQVNCTPLPLAGRAVRFCGAEGSAVPCGVAVAVLVAVEVAADVGVLVGVAVAVGVAVLVAVKFAVGVGVFVAMGVVVGVLVAVGVGVGPPPQDANLKLPMRVRQLNWDEP